MPLSIPRAVQRLLAGAARGAAVLTVLTLVSCRAAQEQSYQPTYGEQAVSDTAQVYVFAVHPLHSPKRLFEVYQPLVDYLNARLQKVSLRLEASANYAAFEEKLRRREAHLALPNPYQTLEAQKEGWRVFAKMGDDEQFRGIVLVRKDSGIREPADLRGKAVSYPAPTALAATMLPQRFFHDHGINVQKDIDNRYVGTQESSIMNVALGRTAAGATWPQPWRAFMKEHPHEAAKLEVKWTTPHLLNNAVMARGDLPLETVQEIERLLGTLHENAEGRSVLAGIGLSRFEYANDTSYEPVRAFVAAFERDIRPVHLTR